MHNLKARVEGAAILTQRKASRRARDRKSR
jgi:hypothetical protein